MYFTDITADAMESHLGNSLKYSLDTLQIQKGLFSFEFVSIWENSLEMGTFCSVPVVL